MTGLKEDQGEGRMTVTNKRKPHADSSKESLPQMSRRLKSRKEVIGYKRFINTSRSGGPERKRGKVPVKQGYKRSLPTSTNSFNNYRKKFRREEAAMPEQDTGRYNLRFRRKEITEFRPSREQIQDQGGPVRSKGRRYQDYKPYTKDQGYKQLSTSQSRQEPKRGRSSCQNSRSRGAQQQQRQEMGGKSTSRRTESLEVLVGDISNKKH
ncbi:uncharacterized protein TNCV_1630511 [Trichonephila clavipes]|uniref:Uncharacterized protein n=1 Tax=Trichonephila clavipes TaxID=2585209 RepID=A0A8X6VWM3_TRICX|nr:uncharacterized protein TNCV_1630511 [Trichonephila clavipes]